MPSFSSIRRSSEQNTEEEVVNSGHELSNGNSENNNLVAVEVLEVIDLFDPLLISQRIGARNIRSEEEGDRDQRELTNGLSQNHNGIVGNEADRENRQELVNGFHENPRPESPNTRNRPDLVLQMIDCPVCGLSRNTTIEEIHEHLSDSHPHYVRFELCPICDNFVVTDENYSVPVNLGPPLFGPFHSRRHPFPCPFHADWEAFKRLRQLRDHIHDIHINSRRFCQVCQAIVSDEQDFADHMMSHVFHNHRTYSMLYPDILRSPQVYYAESSLGIRGRSGMHTPAFHNPPDASDGMT